jgi:predicted transcriptional regulator
MSDQIILQKLERIERQLSNIARKNVKKASWVKVGWITDLTGWDREKMRQAREQGLVEWKDDAKLGRVYNIDSIPQMFIIKKATI